jgi:hypothetical protein
VKFVPVKPEHVAFYNPHQLISHFARLNLMESMCSKQQDGNFTNNWTPQNILCIISPDY